MTAFQLLTIVGGSAVFAGSMVALGTRNHCGQCLKRIYFWQSRAHFLAGARRGWFHTQCDDVKAATPSRPEEVGMSQINHAH
jgi:hypothetical protein